METEILTTESCQDFLFAMNSPVIRERYSTGLRSFFAHIDIKGKRMDERCREFIEKMKENKTKGNSKWAYACVVKFLQYQKDRYDKKERSGSTVRGYYKAVKLFAEVNDILLPWSKIKRGFPKGRHYAVTNPNNKSKSRLEQKLAASSGGTSRQTATKRKQRFQ